MKVPQNAVRASSMPYQYLLKLFCRFDRGEMEKSNLIKRKIGVIVYYQTARRISCGCSQRNINIRTSTILGFDSMYFSYHAGNKL